MIVLRVQQSEEVLVRAMGIIVTVKRVEGREVTLGFRYAEGTKAVIPEKNSCKSGRNRLQSE